MANSTDVTLPMSALLADDDPDFVPSTSPHLKIFYKMERRLCYSYLQSCCGRITQLMSDSYTSVVFFSSNLALALGANPQGVFDEAHNFRSSIT